MSHTLTEKEINSIPAGRLMNTLIQEYVFDEKPSRWSNFHQKDLACHWFEEHPRACAEDDGGYCTADSVPNYSGEISHAMSLADSPALKGKPLVTHTENAQTIFPAMEKRFWASFSSVPFQERNKYYRRADWVSAETLPLAICRAALLSV